MWLILCHAGDDAAVWAYHGLRARGLAPLELVSAEALACSLRWEHRVGARGASLDVQLAGGPRIRGEEVRGVLNRIHLAQLPFWRTASEKDRDYVLQEVNAFYLSWLNALPGRVLNPVSPLGLCGAWRHDAVWTLLAARSGLATRPYLSTNASPKRGSRAVTVLDGAVTGSAAPPHVAGGCRKLSDLSATPLLGVEFEVTPEGEWIFASATPFPDLRLGGTPLLDALAAALRCQPVAP